MASFGYLIFAAALLATVNGRVQRIGNLMKASTSGIDVAGATFIINDIVLQDGVVFAYRAFFRSDSPMRFQIWRPIIQQSATSGGDSAEGSAKEFQLITETRVVPSVLNGVEDVYIESKLVELCTRVNKGDRLGVHFEESPGAVGYVFDSSDPRAYGGTIDSSNPNYADHPITFDLLAFPFDFSVAAYVDTDLSRYNDSDVKVQCPSGLLIPTIEDVTPVPTSPPPPPTGRPGDTGATGPMGAAGSDGMHGATGFTGLAGDHGATGATGSMGVAGVVGKDGVNGVDGAVGGTGATGVMGPRGEAGRDGEMGPAGPQGETVTVFVDVDGNAVSLTKEEETFMTSDLAMLILYVWLGFVTILTIVLIFILCVVISRRRRTDNHQAYADHTYDQAYDHNINIGNILTRADSKRTMERLPSIRDVECANLEDYGVDQGSWMGTMKSTNETMYSTETLTDDSPANSNSGLVNENGYVNHGAAL